MSKEYILSRIHSQKSNSQSNETHHVKKCESFHPFDLPCSVGNVVHFRAFQWPKHCTALHCTPLYTGLEQGALACFDQTNASPVRWVGGAAGAAFMYIALYCTYVLPRDQAALCLIWGADFHSLPPLKNTQLHHHHRTQRSIGSPASSVAT